MVKLIMSVERQEFFYIFTDLSNKTTVAILIYQDNKILFANPTTSQITGYKNEELIGMNFWELVDDNFKEIVKKRGLERQRGLDSHHKYDVLVKRKDGKKRWVLIEGRTTIYRGRPAGLVTAIDIHEEKVSKQHLEQQAILLSILNKLDNKLKNVLTEEQLLNIVKKSIAKHPDITCFTFFLLDENKNIANFTSYNLKKSLFNKYINKSYEKLPGCFQQLKAKKTLVVNKSKLYSFCKGCILSKRNRGDFVVLKRLEYKEKLLGFISITFRREQKILEKFEHILLNEILNTIAKTIFELKQNLALNKLEENFKTFLENNIAAIAITTPEGSFIDCNQAFLNLFNYSSKEEILKKPASSFYKDNKQRKYFIKLLKNKKVVKNIEMTYLDKNGKEVFVLENAVGKFEGDELKYIYSFLYDITFHRKIANHLINTEKLASINALTGNIAHEINNLLTPIATLSSHLLNDKEVNPKVKNILKLISDSAFKASNIINRVLEFSMIEKSAKKLISPEKLLNDFIEIYKDNIPKNISLKIHCDNDIPAIEADYNQIFQVFRNILTNSIEALPNGGNIKVTLQKVSPETLPTKIQDYEKIYIEFMFKDDGLGIKKEHLSKVFEPFYTTKKDKESLGLGLYSAYSIIKQHNGHIFIDSVENKGTEVKIYLPTILDAFNTTNEEHLKKQ